MDTSGIFNRISKRYDLLNHLFSMNIDRLWRRGAVNRICSDMPEGQARVLDVACGTGELSIMLSKRGFKVTGIDISEGMLAVAKERIERKCRDNRPELMVADAANPPFPPCSFDVVTIAYGIRNFDNRAAALCRLLDVLKPGGELLILEFGEPVNRPIRYLYRLYFKHVLPFLAKMLTLGKEKGAYKYFVHSVEQFPKFEKFCAEIREAGYEQVAFKRQTWGISVMYTGRKAEAET